MSYQAKDHYFKLAKAQGLKARSAFKLEEIHNKFRLLKKGDRVLDLGCSPGSWSQWASPLVGPTGQIVGIDLKPVDLKLDNAQFFVGDIFEFVWPQSWGRFQVVLSDMAPKTTGIKSTDQARSVDLCQMALDCADRFLAPGGHVVIKLFHCDDFKILKERMQRDYKRFEALKPQSTRSMSKEIFLIGLNRRG